MYFGSVKFFKHLIIFFIALIFILPIALAIIFGIKFSNTSDRLDEISEYISEHSAPASESEMPSGNSHDLIEPDPTPEFTPSPVPASDNAAKPAEDGEKGKTGGSDENAEPSGAAPDSAPADSGSSNGDAGGGTGASQSESSIFPASSAAAEADKDDEINALEAKIAELSSRLESLEGRSSAGSQQSTAYSSGGGNKELEYEISSLRSQIKELKDNAAASGSSPADGGDEDEPAYISLYPELYVSSHGSKAPDAGSLYLSFDGALSSETALILDKLDSLGIKAAFFVRPAADGSDAALIRRIYKSGHTLGVFCFNNANNETHSTVEDFLSDFSSAAALIKSASGASPAVFRFPASSIRASNLLLYTSLMSEMTRRGYTYFDYTVDSLDTEPSASAESVSAYTADALNGLSCGIVRFHSGSIVAAGAIELLVPELLEQGFHFEALNETVTPVSFPNIQE